MTMDSPLTLDTLMAALRAAAEPTRLRLLALCAQGELTVSELTQILGQSQPRVSRHLKLLCEAGLLERVPEGTWAFYRVGDRLPSVRQCAERQGVSPSTVVAAYDQLLAQGLIEARKNRGFFVREAVAAPASGEPGAGDASSERALRAWSTATGVVDAAPPPRSC